MAEPPREPGWYRLTVQGWERVPDAEAQADFAAMAPGYWDLVYFDTTAAGAEVPLF